MPREPGPAPEAGEPLEGAPARQRADFWGDADADVDDVDDIRPADDPAAMVASLGPRRCPAGETIAEHYFKAIYDRAAALAVALAASSDLLPPPDDDA